MHWYDILYTQVSKGVHKTIKDVVISANPENPPAALLVLKELLEQQCKVCTTCHTHSSATHMHNPLKNLFQSKVDRQECELVFTLVWKNGNYVAGSTKFIQQKTPNNFDKIQGLLAYLKIACLFLFWGGWTAFAMVIVLPNLAYSSCTHSTTTLMASFLRQICSLSRSIGT